MSAMGPYIMFGVILSLFCLGLIYAAVESRRQDLMARRSIILVILMFLAIFGLIAFFFIYVLGPAATSAPAGGG